MKITRTGARQVKETGTDNQNPVVWKKPPPQLKRVWWLGTPPAQTTPQFGAKGEKHAARKTTSLHPEDPHQTTTR